MATQKMPKCLCGCGGSTKGGRFIPGHDAKLRGLIQRGEIKKPTSEQMKFFRSHGWKKDGK